MNIKSIRVLSALIAASMAASVIPCVSAEDLTGNAEIISGELEADGVADDVGNTDIDDFADEIDDTDGLEDINLSVMSEAVGGHLVSMDFEDCALGDDPINSTVSGVGFTVVDGGTVGGKTGKVLQLGATDTSVSSNNKIALGSFTWGTGLGEREVVTSFMAHSDKALSSEQATFAIASGTSGANIAGGFMFSKGNINLSAQNASGEMKDTSASKSYSANDWFKVIMVSHVDANDNITETEYYINGVRQSLTCVPISGQQPKMFRVHFATGAAPTLFYIDDLNIVDFRQELDYLDNIFAFAMEEELPETVLNGEDEIALPTEYKGAAVTWTSSNPSVIGTDGTVTHGDAQEEVTLTATLTYNGEPGYEVSGVSMASEVEHEFTVSVEQGGELSDEMKVRRVVSTLQDQFNVVQTTEDFTVPTEVVYPQDPTIKGDVSWSSDSIYAAVSGGNVTVTQPGYTESDAVVTLTATVTVGSASDTVDFSVTIPRNAKPVYDSDKISYAVNQLLGLNFDENGKKVTSASIHLPETIEYTDGETLASITWSSDNTQYMGHDGTLYEQPETGTYSLNLTATITAGAITQTYVYPVVIRGSEIVKAYPGAQGYGTQTRGGAGGYVVHVTSLAAEGPGTLTEALESKSGRRTIVFDVGGTIDLTPLGRALQIRGEDDYHLTIAGQTAPGEGIQLKGYGITLTNVQDVIIRNISIRIGDVRKAGDTYQSDPLSATGANKRVVLDHITMCWAVDMGFRVYGQEITMSNCMVTKGLYWNTPHEKGKHNYAGMFGPLYGSFYGNYIADMGQRAPRIIDNKYVDVRNNVVANSKYSFDICNYEWMSANTRFNIVNNVVLKGSPNPGGSTSNTTSAGSYKYFQGRTYSSGVLSYSVNNYDNTAGAREVNPSDETITGAIWNTGTSASVKKSRLEKELMPFADSYSYTDTQYRDMIFPDNISLTDYDNSIVSHQGNTLMNYPFAAPSMQTYSANDTVKYVLENAGSRAPTADILTRRYLAEGRTRLHIYSDFSKVSKTYGIQLVDSDYDKETAYGLPVHTHSTYLDANGMKVYAIDGINQNNYETIDLSKYTLSEEHKFVTAADREDTDTPTHLDSLYAMDTKGNKYFVIIDEYAKNEDGSYTDDDIYSAFKILDIDGNELIPPTDYCSDADSSWTDGMHWTNSANKSVVLEWTDWGDGPANYAPVSDNVVDGNIGPIKTSVEWNEYDWPQLPTTYRDGKWDSNGDGIPDFFVKLMGWDQNPDYNPKKDISQLDYEGRGYTNLEYYINDYCCGDQERADAEEDEPIPAENVRDGSSQYNTHVSHEILFNTVRRAKAQVFYNEGEVFNSNTAQRIDLNTCYDYNNDSYTSATDFETYFSAVLTGLKAGTTYSYKIKTYSDTGVENMSEETYHFTTLSEAAASGKPGRPRITKYVAFDEQVTILFEPYSSNKTWSQTSSSINGRLLTTINNNIYDTKTDHYILRYSENADMSNAESIIIDPTATKYVVTGLSNDKQYYIDLRAVSVDGTESDPAIYNQKTVSDTGSVDKDGNPIYAVESIKISGSSIEEYHTAYDVPFNTIAVHPTKYVLNVDFEQEFLDNGIGANETTKFSTVFGDIYDWYIYTLGGLPIPAAPAGYTNPILLLRDSSHDHAFTLAKAFDTALSGQSTIEAKIMIENEALDPMNQSPEFRFYLQQDSADSDSIEEGDVETSDISEATAFGTIVSITFSKNEINYDGTAISRYNLGQWYVLKILLDEEAGTCSVYINDKLIRSGLEYSDSATSNKIARLYLNSRLAGKQDVYIEYIKAYSGWAEPIEGETDPDATPVPDNTVQEGTSGMRPTAGSGGGGGGGGGGAVTVTATPAPDATAEPDTTSVPSATAEPSDEKKSFKDMSGFDWAQEAVDELSLRGIVTGVSDDEFAPGRNITRAEFLTLLMRGFDLTDENAVCGFTDVPESAWYYNTVASAYSMGIVNGYTEDYFGAEDTITRQDMTVMITRLLAKLHLDLPKTNTYEAFADEASIADYAKSSVTALYEAGIIDGVGDGKFDPTGTTTRAAAAKVLYGTLRPMWDNPGEE